LLLQRNHKYHDINLQQLQPQQ